MKARAETTSSSMLWTFIVLIFLLNLVNYIDRVVISFAIEPIRRDFGIDNADFGLAMTLFAAGAIAVNFISGILLDRFGVKIVWLIGLATWTTAMFMLGMVEYWWLFLVFRVILGLGEGVNFPAMNRAISDWIPPHHSSKVAAACLIGVPGAFLLGGPLFGFLIDGVGWRNTFMLLSGVSLVLLLALFFLYRNPGRSATHERRNMSGWLTLLKNPTLLSTSWSFFAFGAILYFGLTWIPGYFEQTFKLELSRIGWFTTLPWGLAVILMQLVAWWSDVLHKRTGNTRSSRVHFIIVFQLLAAACFIPLIFVETSTWAIVWLTLGIGCSMAPNAPYYSILTDLFGDRSGAATGIMVTFFSASGFLLPVIIGLLADQSGNFDSAFLLIACIVGSGSLGMFFFARQQSAGT